MKKLVFVLIASLLYALAFAVGPMDSLKSYKSAFEISQRSSSHMDINFSLPEYQIETKSYGNKNYQRIVLPDAGTLMESGMPELPVITTSIAVPHSGSVNIEVLGSDQRIVSNFEAYPLQEGADLDVPKAFQKNMDYYSNGSNYPVESIRYSDPMILRDFRIVTIQINPFSYDASTHQLTVKDNIQMRVNFTNTPGVNELSAPVQYVSPSFDKVYQSIIQNYGDYRNFMVSNTPPRYLIIHGTTSIDANFTNALDAFVLWKRQKGADVDIATTATNSAGNTTTTIQTYIRNRYNNPETRPDFVILLGDTSGSYTIPYFTNNSGGSDYPFSFMNTGDILGDVFLGRISVENISQLLVVLNKIYLYERDIDLTTASWLNRMLLVGDNSPSGISTMYISKFIKEKALEENPNYTFTELYGPDFSSFVSSINAAFNQGIGFHSYRGYIDHEPPGESSLYNGFMLPHAVIITCATGNYAGGTGETEALIRYGSTAAPKGSVTAIGMSTASTHTAFNNVLHGGIFDGIFTYGMRTLGEALLHGKLYMNQIYGVSTAYNVERFTHWCNLMGDPTMEVFTGIPNSFTASTSNLIPVGLSLLDVAVTDASMLPVADASVVLSLGSTILSRGYTDTEGNVILIMPQVLTPGNAVLTISKHNFKPLQQQIVISNVSTLVANSIVISDDNVGASTGNNNGLASAGETLEILFGLKNTGAETVSGISGIVTCQSPWVTITQGNITYPSISGGGTGNNFDPIIIQVSPATPHNTMLRLHLMLTDSNQGTYDISEFIPVEASKMIFVSLQVDDLGNQKLDPGETAPLNITIKNVGTIPVQNVFARLYTENDLISITDNTAYFGTLPVNTAVSTIENNFIVWQRPESLPGMVMPLSLRLYNADGFEQYVPLSLTVGNVTQTDPLGPDTYGYVIYDWTDVGYPEAAVYNWVEIAPPAGGFGVPLNITDPHTSTEGDMVGANSVAVVNLPFPFQFYGRMYQQITVCSNGFIAMGASANAEFRNYRLPGAMGPSPMIAPFWDDLATHSGSGIYTYFDRSNQSFIVEWYNMKNGYNGSSIETFQVILYDQAVYSTSLGDGPIKFQYHTFNNIDVGDYSSYTPKHGNYATIGIEDHTGTRGLEYTYNNTYPTAAAPLSNGKALYITNVPIYYEAAHLLIAETFLAADNGLLQPGQTADLGVQLQNTGNLAATEVTAILSSTDEFVTMVNSTSEYFDLLPETSGVNRDPFSFTIAENCPSNHVITFNLNVTSGEYIWDRQFSLRVDATDLQYHSYMICDYDGNNSGIIEPGEQVKLIVNLKNASQVEAKNVVTTLSSTVSGMNILNPTVELQKVGANEIFQIVYNLDFSNVEESSAYLPFMFTADPASGLSVSHMLHLPYNLPDVNHPFEVYNGGFVSESGWLWGRHNTINAPSGTKLWGTTLGGAYPDLVQYNLYTPQYNLSSGSLLSFKNYFGTQTNYDGGNISISTNGGQNWSLLTPNGGYPSANVAALNAAGWSGNGTTWQTVNFDLGSYANQNVMFKFSFASNDENTGVGWFIDDFLLTGVNQRTGFLHGVVFSSAGIDPSLATVVSNKRYATNPYSNGNFRLYLPNGTHSASAYMSHHQSSSLNNIQINTNTPVVYTEFTLIDLPKPSSITFEVDNDTGLLSISWTNPIDPVLPVTGYRVYRRFDTGPFVKVYEGEDTAYSEYLTLHGRYKYYITAVFVNAEGTPSTMLDFSFPYTSNPDDIAPAMITALGKNYPNPFNPTTTLSFSLAKASPAQLTIFNAKGQLVRRLVNSQYSAGQHSVVWDGKDDLGRSVSSGIYFYRMSTTNYTQTRKMLLMK